MPKSRRDEYLRGKRYEDWIFKNSNQNLIIMNYSNTFQISKERERELLEPRVNSASFPPAVLVSDFYLLLFIRSSNIALLLFYLKGTNTTRKQEKGKAPRKPSIC